MTLDLIFPPPWSTSSVTYMALPTLAAYLRGQGVTVRQHDANLRFCQLMLQRDRLEAARSRLSAMLRSTSAGRPPHSPDFIHWARIMLALSDYVVDGIEQAIADLRTRPNQVPVLERAYSVIVNACRLLSLPHYPGIWTYGGYEYEHRLVSDLGEAVERASADESNVFAQCFRDEIVPELFRADGTTFGICLAFIDQLVASLTLARIIKQQRADATIVLGGPLIPYMADAIRNVPQFFDLIDFVVVGEGERPLLALLRELEGTRRFDRVPSLIRRDGSEMCAQTPPAAPLSPREWPLPAFGLASGRLHDYWIGSFSLPYLTSRGCYWSKCTFCSINSTYGALVRAKPIDVVVDELRTLKNTHHCDCFEFQDEAIAPGRVRQLSEALIAADLRIFWFTLARIEPQFSRETLRLAYRAGCRFISWGIESGSQRVLDRMQKHTHREEAMRVLRDSHEAGIWNNIFIMLGYPGESEADFQQTVDFIREASPWIHYLVFGTFRLEKCTPLFQNPEQFGIRLKPYPDDRCRPDYAYEDLTGLAANKMDRYARFAKVAREHPAAYYLGLTVGELLNRLADGTGRDELRNEQRCRAERQQRVAAAIRSPEDWHVNPGSEIVWADLPHVGAAPQGSPLALALDHGSGNALVMERRLAEIFQDPMRLQQRLLRCAACEENGPADVEFRALAENALQSLSFSIMTVPMPGKERESCASTSR